MSDDFTLHDGTPVKLGCKPPLVQRFGAVPRWSEKNPVLPENECEDHDDLAQFCEAPKTQHYNNCTNASIAWLAQAAFKSAGLTCPDLSMSFLYSFTNGGTDEGAMCRDVAAAWMTKGLAPESLVPESQIYMPRGGWSNEILLAALQYCGLEIYQCENWADTRSALARRFLVYHGFVLGNAFFRTRGDGVVPPFDGSLKAGHAMGSRGLTRAIDGNLRTITPNTWGNEFGKAGVGYIDPSYFWDARGNYVNLDCYAFRAVKRTDPLPVAK